MENILAPFQLGKQKQTILVLLGMLASLWVVNMSRNYLTNNFKLNDIYFLTSVSSIAAFIPVFLYCAKHRNIIPSLRAPKIEYTAVAILHVVSEIFSNFAINTIGTAGQSLFSSITLILVMVGNLALFKRRPSAFLVITSCLIAFSLVTLSIGCIQKSVYISSECLFSVFSTIIFESIIANIYESLVITYGSTHYEIMLPILFLETLFSTFIAYKSGTLIKCLKMVICHPIAALILLFYTIASAALIHLFVYCIKLLNSLLAVTSQSSMKIAYNVIIKGKFSRLDAIASAILSISLVSQVYVSTTKEEEHNDILLETDTTFLQREIFPSVSDDDCL